MAPWPSGKAEVCKTFMIGPTPIGASKLKSEKMLKNQYFLAFCCNFYKNKKSVISRVLKDKNLYDMNSCVKIVLKK